MKSPILRETMKDERLEVLEKMENWSKVKSQDGFIGYVENKCLSEETIVVEKPVTDYIEPEYTTRQLDEKVCLGWHSIGGAGGNDTLESYVANVKGMNVIAPTWFSLSDNEGGYESFASESYVTIWGIRFGACWMILIIILRIRMPGWMCLKYCQPQPLETD